MHFHARGETEQSEAKWTLRMNVEDVKQVRGRKKPTQEKLKINNHLQKRDGKAVSALVEL